jgi:hypothetical protein
MVPTKVDAAGVVDLLDIAVGDHDRERLDRACLRYRAGPAELAGVFEDRLVVGVVGYQRHTDWPGLVWRVELLHIATRPDRQRRGIAAAMVGWVLAQHPGASSRPRRIVHRSVSAGGPPSHTCTVIGVIEVVLVRAQHHQCVAVSCARLRGLGLFEQFEIVVEIPESTRNAELAVVHGQDHGVLTDLSCAAHWPIMTRIELPDPRIDGHPLPARTAERIYAGATMRASWRGLSEAAEAYRCPTGRHACHAWPAGRDEPALPQRQPRLQPG